VALGQFIHALHRPAPAGAPPNTWRGVPLAHRMGILRQHLRELDGTVDDVAVLELWQRALAARTWSAPPLWLHGDLHPGNLLVSGGRVVAVIDFGDLTAGDPATDLSIAWMLLSSSERSTFRAAASGGHDPIDEDTWMRARGWALALGLAYWAALSEDDPMGRLGRATVDAVLVDAG
jgi:aminoglycoside phosphotransferase (APT) family kinase protein